LPESVISKKKGVRPKKRGQANILHFMADVKYHRKILPDVGKKS